LSHAGIPTAADADAAAINVQQLRISKVSIGPACYLDCDGEAPRLGNIWVLSDDFVDLNYPEGTLPEGRLDKRKALFVRTVSRIGMVILRVIGMTRSAARLWRATDSER